MTVVISRAVTAPKALPENRPLTRNDWFVMAHLLRGRAQVGQGIVGQEDHSSKKDLISVPYRFEKAWYRELDGLFQFFVDSLDFFLNLLPR